jgi:regulator of cell morphogenesis and NO signaling
MYQTTSLYLTPRLKVADAVLNSPRLLLLLEYFGIYVPLEEKTIQEVCDENQLNIEVFLTFADLYNGATYTTPIQFPFAEVIPIVRFLKSSHRYYTQEKYPDIKHIIGEMYHSDEKKEMSLVEKFCNEYFRELTQHLDYEDRVAFPYMISLYDHVKEKKKFDAPVTYSVKEYKEHHDDIEEKLNDLKNLLIKYLPQQNDQRKRRRLFFNLYELESDLNVHSKIEDMILIPLIERMEQYLKSDSE